MYKLEVVTEEKFNTYKALSSRYKDLIYRIFNNNTCISKILVYENNKYIFGYKVNKKGRFYYG